MVLMVVNAVALDNSFNVYTGGNFTNASGQTALNIARWNGLNWNSLSLPTAISQYTFGGEVFTQNITSNQLVTIECWGSGGQTGGGLGANGGKGGYSSTTFTPSSSGQLKIVVGQSGVNAGAGGYSTSGSAFGGNGGGASYVYFGSGSSFDLKCVAGGGGGGGAGSGGVSNGTGGNSSSNGANGGPFGDQPTGGLGAVGSTPGSGGIDKPNGTSTNSGSGPMSLNVSEVGLLLAYNGANASTSSLPGTAFGAGGGGGSGYAGGGAGGFDSLQSNNEGAGGGGGSNFGDIFLSDGTTAPSYPGGGIATANNNGFVRITVSTGIFGVGPDISANVNAIVSDQSNNVFVGGTFTQAGDQSCNNIARWSGSAWFPVGLGINNTVHALVFDNSNNLYAGGNFTRAGDTSVNFIAKWNGTSWSPLPQQVNNTVYDLAFANNNLYAVGSFTQAGNIDANFVAVWDGNNWQSLNSNNFNGIAGRSIVVKNNLIYLGGTFTTPLNIGNYTQRTVNSTYIIPINNLGKQTKRIL